MEKEKTIVNFSEKKKKFNPIISLLVNSNQLGSYAMKTDKRVYAQKHLISKFHRILRNV